MPNQKSNIPTYLPLPDAAAKMDLSEKVLTQLAEAGTIAAIQTPSGELLVAAEDNSTTRHLSIRKR